MTVASKSTTQAHVDGLNEGEPSERLRRLIFTGVLLLPIVLGAVLVGTLQPVRTGDGTEYLLTTVAFGETYQPFITQRVIDRYNELLQREPLKEAFPFSSQHLPTSFYGSPIPNRAGLTYEPLHFWFLGLLTAPYYWLTQHVGLNFAHSYTLLFVTLWLTMVLVAYRSAGVFGGIAATVIVVLSPVLWFVNKPQTEFLTIFSITVALILIDADLVLWAALVMSVAATQNPALSLMVVLLLGFWLYTKRRGPYSLDEMLLCIATIFLLVLAPSYYFPRHGVLSALVAAGAASSKVITVKRVISLFIDPDIGLYPNWPLGLVLVVVGVGALVRKDVAAVVARKIRAKPFLFLFAGVFIVLMTLAQASQPNYNAGGTVHVSRYALWYIPLHYPLVLHCLRRGCALRWSSASVQQRMAVGMTACLLVPAMCLNVIWFHPQRAEVFLEHSAAAGLVYKWFPAVFDPMPEVFIGRTGNPIDGTGRGFKRIDPKRVLVGPSTAYDEGIWAFGVPSCRKIYVLAEMLHIGRANASQRPYGCVAVVDAERLFSEAKAHGGDHDFYLNVSAMEVGKSYPLLAIGRRVAFSSPEAVRYLGEGWSIAEPASRWTDGPVATVGFSLSKEDQAKLAGHRLVLRLEAAGATLQVPVQVARVAVNGKADGVYSWRKDQRPLTDIPVIPDRMGNVLMEFHIQYPLAKAAVNDRALGLMCLFMQLLLF